MRKLTLFLFAIPLIISTALVKKDKNLKKLPKDYQENYVYVMTSALGIDDSTYTVGDFFMSKYEVSNFQYREFLTDLKSENKTEILNQSILDTLVWRDLKFYGEPYIEYYHAHPAYSNYPVVGITKQGAENYCNWLEEKINELDSEQQFEVLLPTRNEWVLAANGNKTNPSYSWGGPYLRNVKGQFLCNFKRIGDERLHEQEDGEISIIAHNFHSFSYDDTFYGYPINNMPDATTPVSLFSVTEFGTYNMNGNVAELTSDDYVCGGSWRNTGYDVRNLSYIMFEEPKCSIGFRPIIRIVKDDFH